MKRLVWVGIAFWFLACEVWYRPRDTGPDTKDWHPDAGVADAGAFSNVGPIVDSAVNPQGTNVDGGASRDGGDGSADAAPPHYDDGTCTPRCDGSCYQGHCSITLASNQNWPSAITVRGSNVYWVTADGLATAAVDGSSWKTLATTEDSPLDIATDSTRVYWTSAGTGPDGGVVRGAMMAMPLGGGAPTTLVSGGAPNILAVGRADAYWSDTTAVFSVPLAGGSARTLAASQDYSWGVAVDDVSVYWVTTGSVLKEPLAGGTPSVLLSEGPDVSGGEFTDLFVDATYVYFTAFSSSGRVRKIPRDGGAAVDLATGQLWPASIVVDATSAYWVTNYGVMKVPLDGGTPTRLTARETTEAAIAVAVDADAVYWTDYSAGTVQRITPK